MSLSQDTIRTVKSTAPVLARHGEAITQLFYHNMFKAHPELLNIFNGTNQKTGDQSRALAAAVYAYAANIDNLEALKSALERIAHKHANLNIQPEHYPIVGKYLLGAVAEVLGEAATDEILQSWAKAYEFLAQLFINLERDIYKRSIEQPGGWYGTREFHIARKVPESAVITSFYLEPVDGKPVASYKPGQFIGIYLKPEGQQYQKIRQYSLSCAPNGKSYRISVKRELGDGHSGLVSNYLHDKIKEGSIVKLSPPSGSFYLDMRCHSPVILISGGVGLTPMMSMFNSLIAEGQSREVRYIHSAINSRTHAFAKHIKNAAKQHNHIQSFLFYDQPEAQDRLHDYAGQMDLNTIREAIQLPDAHYYFCGPIGFMLIVKNTLQGWGVPEKHIHYEVFGPHKNL
ncbi:MAG: NO-inducible flavohemoprotein [Gammaproteobacteria bacterium]|nr:NO-inducible flavohemoprotein [Gammaproteobacteria bacterium]